jgi:hypothetical protein
MIDAKLIKWKQYQTNPNYVSPKEWGKHITIKAQPYTLQNDVLYKLRLDGVLQQCLNGPKAQCALLELCKGPIGRHYGIYNIVQKIWSQIIGEKNN